VFSSTTEMQVSFIFQATGIAFFSPGRLKHEKAFLFATTVSIR